MYFRHHSLDQAAAGVGAAIFTTTCLHPLDLVKTRMQVSQTKQSAIGMLLDIRAKLGIRGLYQGFTANIAGNTASWGLYFMWYSMLKARLVAQRPEDDKILRPSDHLLAAAQAGALTSLITNPLWLMKTRMCIQDPVNPQYTGLASGLRYILRQEGVRGLYRGMVPALFGVSHGAIQFMVYEELKKLGLPATTPSYILMAATSKITATVVTYPYQVVKSRLQASDQLSRIGGVVKLIGTIVRTEGIQGLYRGLHVNIIRVLPGTCLTFASYEFISSQLASID